MRTDFVEGLPAGTPEHSRANAARRSLGRDGEQLFDGLTVIQARAEAEHALELLALLEVQDRRRRLHAEAHHRARRSVAVVTDSAADLPDEALERLDIHLVPVRVHFGPHSYLDKVSLSPEQFFRQLEAAGLQIDRLALPDHADYQRAPWPEGTREVITTEKDAVKLAALPRPHEAEPTVWVLPLDCQLPDPLVRDLLALLSDARARADGPARETQR